MMQDLSSTNHYAGHSGAVPSSPRVHAATLLHLHAPDRELNLAAWMLGLEALPSLDVASEGECGAIAERLTLWPERVLADWRATRQEMTGEGWLE